MKIRICKRMRPYEGYPQHPFYVMYINGVRTKCEIWFRYEHFAQHEINTWHVVACMPNTEPTYLKKFYKLEDAKKYIRSRENLMKIIGGAFWYRCEEDGSCNRTIEEIIAKYIDVNDCRRWADENISASVLIDNPFYSKDDLMFAYATKKSKEFSDCEEFEYNGKTFRKYNPDKELFDELKKE